MQELIGAITANRAIEKWATLFKTPYQFSLAIMGGKQIKPI
nr:MAG TPA: hypothetical protein [Caudoviricetes sp.]